jgi:ATP-dependent Lon protease
MQDEYYLGKKLEAIQEKLDKIKDEEKFNENDEEKEK